MAEMLDLPSWKLGTGDLIQQLAMLVWLNKGEEGKDLYKMVTGARVGYEIYNRMSGQRDLEALQQQFIMAVVDYIKKNPKASEDQLAKEIQKQVETFEALVEMS